MANTVKHKTQTSQTDLGVATELGPDEWNEEHSFSGGANGAFLVRDSTTSDGVSWSTAYVGPYAVGGAVANATQFTLRGAFVPNSGPGNGVAFEILTNLGANAGQDSALCTVDGTLNQAGSSNINNAWGLRINPQFAGAGGGATFQNAGGIHVIALVVPSGTLNASGIKIAGPPTGATNNYPFWVVSGKTYLDTLHVGQSGTFAGQSYIKSAGAGVLGLVVDTAASPSASAQEWRNNGSVRVELDVGTNFFRLNEYDAGSSFGPRLTLGRNSNGSTPSSGWIQFFNKDGTNNPVWVDGAQKLRISSTTNPTNANDLAGSVVGEQTSWYEGKHIIAERTDVAQALAVVLGTKVYDYFFRSDSYLAPDGNAPMHVGVVGYSRHDWFLKNVGPRQDPVLDLAAMHGYEILAIQALDARLGAAEARFKPLDDDVAGLRRRIAELEQEVKTLKGGR